MSGERRAASRLSWLLSPWAILLAVGVGLYLGLQERELALALSPVGAIYLGLLKMCILPVLVSAITVSLGRLLKADGASRSIRRMILVFGVSLLLTSFLGVALGLLASPGKNLADEHMASLGVFVNDSKYLPDLEVSLSQAEVPKESSGLADFLVKMVPQNVFNALSEGINLQVLVFAILFAVALGHLDTQLTAPLFQMLDAVYRAFSNLIRWMMYLLPFGLTALLAEQVAQVGVDILLTMLHFVELTLGAIAGLFLLSMLIIWRRAEIGFWRSLGAMRETILVSLATRSTLASIPSALEGMHRGLGFDRDKVDLVVPLGITLCRYGNVLYSAIVAVFVAQLYQIDLGGQALGIMLIGAILAGVATAGATGVLTLTMLSIVLDPLGLPLEVVLVLLIAIDPIIDPFRTLISVYASCASAALIAPREGIEAEPAPAPIGEEVRA